MIRVLHVIGSLNIGGSQTMILNLYEAIDRSQIQFDFVLDEPEQTALVEKVKQLGARIYEMPKFNGKNLLIVRQAWDLFFAEHPEYKILHSHVRSYASLYIPIAKKHGVKTIIHSHSTSNGSGVGSVVKAMLQYPLRFQADYFFACSDISGKWLFGKRVVRGRKYKMIPNAISIQKYHFNPEVRAEMRRELGIDEDSVLYGHIGRMHEAKNHFFLLDVFQKIHASDLKAKLVLVGAGELFEAVKKKVYDLKLEKCVYLLGARKDPERLLQAFDCLLFPSKWEGLPVGVVEAQVAGLPCFVSDTVTKEVGFSELVHYLPIDQGIQVWVDKVMNADLKRKDVSREIIRAGFDVAEMAEWLCQFYKKL